MEDLNISRETVCLKLEDTGKYQNLSIQQTPKILTCLSAHAASRKRDQPIFSHSLTRAFAFLLKPFVHLKTTENK